MSIKPLDMQVMIPKSSQVSKIQHQDMHKYNQEQFNLGMVNQQKNEKNLKHVVKQEESSNVKFKKDKEGQSGSKKQKKKNKQQNPKDRKHSANPYKNGHFDIKI